MKIIAVAIFIFATGGEAFPTSFDACQDVDSYAVLNMVEYDSQCPDDLLPTYYMSSSETENFYKCYDGLRCSYSCPMNMYFDFTTLRCTNLFIDDEEPSVIDNNNVFDDFFNSFESEESEIKKNNEEEKSGIVLPDDSDDDLWNNGWSENKKSPDYISNGEYSVEGNLLPPIDNKLWVNDETKSEDEDLLINNDRIIGLPKDGDLWWNEKNQKSSDQGIDDENINIDFSNIGKKVQPDIYDTLGLKNFEIPVDPVYDNNRKSDINDQNPDIQKIMKDWYDWFESSEEVKNDDTFNQNPISDDWAAESGLPNFDLSKNDENPKLIGGNDDGPKSWDDILNRPMVENEPINQFDVLLPPIDEGGLVNDNNANGQVPNIQIIGIVVVPNQNWLSTVTGAMQIWTVSVAQALCKIIGC